MSNSQSQLNILSTTSLNDVGFANFNNLKTIKNKDFRNSAGIYFMQRFLFNTQYQKIAKFEIT